MYWILKFLLHNYRDIVCLCIRNWPPSCITQTFQLISAFQAHDHRPFFSVLYGIFCFFPLAPLSAANISRHILLLNPFLSFPFLVYTVIHIHSAFAFIVGLLLQYFVDCVQLLWIISPLMVAFSDVPRLRKGRRAWRGSVPSSFLSLPLPPFSGVDIQGEYVYTPHVRKMRIYITSIYKNN